jgi:CRP-like cAMP-binding protein
MVGRPTGNRLLDGLPAEDLERLLSHLEEVPLTQRQPIHESAALIEDVYFPVTGAISLIATLADGVEVEVGLIGSEGLAGTPVLLGSENRFQRGICPAHRGGAAHSDRVLARGLRGEPDLTAAAS